MPPPDKHEVVVATETLRTEADMWLHNGDQLQAIAGKADGLRMSRMEAGVFQLLVSAHDEIADQITARCREGQQRMTAIATTLHQVADTYDAEDANNLHELKNLY